MRVLQVTAKICGTEEVQHNGLPMNYPIIYLNVLDLKCKKRVSPVPHFEKSKFVELLWLMARTASSLPTFVSWEG